MRLEHSRHDQISVQCFEIIRQSLDSPEFQARHRARPQDFTRQRALGFGVVLMLLLQKTVRSAQLHLHEFFQALGRTLGRVTASAWTQARRKFRHAAFIELNQKAVLEVVYGPENSPAVRRWRGHRLLALDSSLICLPETEAMGQEFGWVEGRNQKGRWGRHVQGRLSVLYDVLNRIPVHPLLLDPRVVERVAAEEHLTQAADGDVVLLDRGYAGYPLWARFLAARQHFICRCARSSFQTAKDLFAQDRAGVSVTVTLTPCKGSAQAVAQGGLSETVTVRFVTVRLSTGALEVLATSLVDETQYPTELFGQAYRHRWGIETYYALLKGRLDLENFSGRSPEAVRQDVYATVLLSNLETMLSEPGPRPMDPAQTGSAARARQINRAVSFHAIKTLLLDLLLSPKPLEEIMAQMRTLFNGAPVCKRPERKPPRQKTSAWRSYRFQRYLRKGTF